MSVQPTAQAGPSSGPVTSNWARGQRARWAQTATRGGGPGAQGVGDQYSELRKLFNKIIMQGQLTARQQSQRARHERERQEQEACMQVEVQGASNVPVLPVCEHADMQ